MKDCNVKEYVSKKNPEKKYQPLVGDPCYSYSRLAKETFLRNKYCSFLYLICQATIELEIE